MNLNTTYATKLLFQHRLGQLPEPDKVTTAELDEAAAQSYADSFQTDFNALAEADNGEHDLNSAIGVVDFQPVRSGRLDRRDFSGNSKDGRITETVVSDRATFIEERTAGPNGHQNVQVIVKDGYQRVVDSRLQGQQLVQQAWNISEL